MFTQLNRKAFLDFQKKSWQVKNRFELILLPSAVSISSVVSIGSTAISGLAGLNVAKLHLREITFPPSVSFDYEALHEHKYISKVTHPTTVTMRFIEDEQGTVIRYIMAWINDTYAQPDPTNLLEAGQSLITGVTGINLGTGYALRENQLLARRTGMLLLEEKGGNRDAPIYPRIMMWGLGFQSVAEVTLNHEDASPLEYEVTCSVDRVFIPTLV
jgi:hypothetical protein